jgi:phenylpyruvate tautomerase PptA (4-oxalocrotonate tautomerase family)
MTTLEKPDSPVLICIDSVQQNGWTIEVSKHRDRHGVGPEICYLRHPT